MLESKICSKLCNSKYSKTDSVFVNRNIKAGYNHNWIIDGLPASMPILMLLLILKFMVLDLRLVKLIIKILLIYLIILKLLLNIIREKMMNLELLELLSLLIL